MSTIMSRKTLLSKKRKLDSAVEAIANEPVAETLAVYPIPSTEKNGTRR